MSYEELRKAILKTIQRTEKKPSTVEVTVERERPTVESTVERKRTKREVKKEEEKRPKKRKALRTTFENNSTILRAFCLLITGNDIRTKNIDTAKEIVKALARTYGPEEMIKAILEIVDPEKRSQLVGMIK